MTKDIISGSLLEMLASLEIILKQLDIDYYLVGALARDIGLSDDPKFVSKRKTNDVDIAILLANEEQFYNVKRKLLESGDFTAHETETIKLFYKHGIELDILPFGDIENDDRETRLTQPRLFVVDMPGFKEIFPTTKTYHLDAGKTLKVCPLEGLVLLKLIANDDKPGRTKDITDIEHIIAMYFDLNDLEIYTDHMDIMDIYDTADRDYLELVSARAIGRKIAGILADSNALRERLLSILDRKTTGAYWPAIAAGIRDIT